ncbi:MAG: zf-HC2 domain-containing protein [Rhodothermales bacterium]
MSAPSHVDHLLSDYLDGTLPAVQYNTVEQHLSDCPACRAEFERLHALVTALHALPRSVAPSRDLWNGIEAQIASPDRSRRGPDRAAKRGAAAWRRLGVAAVVVALVGLSALWWRGSFSRPAWDVTPLVGTPRIGETALTETGALRVGEWLETDAASRARLQVGRIGNVELAPGTRLQLREAEAPAHRLNLAQGRIHARIWAPPRQFFVETPAGLAVDLGCEYTLEVDSSGSSLLHVLSGYVGFSRATREVIVPAGWMVRARPGRIPGTPFSAASSSTLRDALRRFDFEGGGAEALTDVLAEARPADALTLWELLWRAEERERGRVYDRLVTLTPPPPGATREGVLTRDPEVVEAWRQHLGVDVMYWLSYKKKKLLEEQLEGEKRGGQGGI